MMSYQNTPCIDEKETADIPIVVSYRWKWWRVAIVIAGLTMLVAVGAVLLQDGSITTATEGFVLATQGTGCAPCIPASGTFNGNSVTLNGVGQTYPYETCWRFSNTDLYCWTKSYQCNFWPYAYFECVPNGDYGAQAWHTVGPDTLDPVDLTVPQLCGSPCQGQHGRDG